MIPAAAGSTEGLRPGSDTLESVNLTALPSLSPEALSCKRRETLVALLKMGKREAASVPRLELKGSTPGGQDPPRHRPWPAASAPVDWSLLLQRSRDSPSLRPRLPRPGDVLIELNSGLLSLSKPWLNLTREIFGQDPNMIGDLKRCARFVMRAGNIAGHRDFYDHGLTVALLYGLDGARPLKLRELGRLTHRSSNSAWNMVDGVLGQLRHPRFSETLRRDLFSRRPYSGRVPGEPDGVPSARD